MENCWLYNNCNHKDCDKDYCPRAFKLNNLYINAGFEFTQRFHPDFIVDECDLTAFNKLNDIRKDIVNFVDSGQNLFIHSRTCGNGKTSWAFTLVQAYFDRIWPRATDTCHALYISTSKYLNEMKAAITYGPTEYLDRIRKNVLTADVVIWDDISTKNASDYDIELLLSSIDNRISAGKSNIFTSNIPVEELSRTIGLRLASRIGGSVDIEFNGVDKRGMKGISR